MRFLPLILKRLLRQPLRSSLIVLSVAVAVFLYAAVEAVQAGVRRATLRAADDATLVVYRENRYCPFTSQLPQHYQPRIERIEGVAAVVPMKITVSNCRASLDVVTFRGVPADDFAAAILPGFEITTGSFAAWRGRSDAALIGQALAERRGLKVGDRFSAAGITVYVAAIGRTADPQSRNAAYTHLPFLQEASRHGGTGGIVTQFNVEVSDPAQLEQVARAIDAEFANESEPTFTQPEKAFARAAATDVVVAVGFARWLGWGALAAVFALVANAIVLAVHERRRELAVFETLGFTAPRLGGLILAEGGLVGLAGGLLGTVGALGSLAAADLSVAMEGVQLEISAEPALLAWGVGAAVLLSVAAGVVPAARLAQRELAEAFRAV